MRTSKVVRCAVVFGMLVTFAGGLAFGQEQRPARRPPRGFDPTRMRQRFMDRIKDYIEAADEEWAVLRPRIEKVMALSREASGFGRMFGVMRRRGGPGGAPGAPRAEQPQSDVARAVQELQAALENEQATADEINAKLTALREAREKVKQELAQAREALRELVTPRQEARLVLLGILD